MTKVNELSAREVVPGFFGRFVHGAQSTLAFWEARQGHELSLHQHLHEQITYIVSGEIEMQINGEKIILSAGMAAVIPPHTPHSGYAIRDCVIIDSFSPARDDYR
jgi:quercetin dioxygenase-like cupin family protein